MVSKRSLGTMMISIRLLGTMVQSDMSLGTMVISDWLFGKSQTFTLVNLLCELVYNHQI